MRINPGHIVRPETVSWDVASSPDESACVIVYYTADGKIEEVFHLKSDGAYASGSIDLMGSIDIA